MLKKILKASAAFAAVFFITVIITEEFAYARIGGSRSFGSRGSRSYSSPSRSYSQPSRTNPQGSYNQPQNSMLRNLGMGMAGGFLGSMLFRGLGYGSTGMGGGGGIGILEILLIGGLGLMLYNMYKKKKAAGSGNSFSLNRSSIFGNNNNAAYTRQPDLSDIKASDSSFDEIRFKDNVMDMFFKIQAAWMNRDLSSVKSLLTDEARNFLQEDIDELKRLKQINKLENIAVRTVDINDAWQETGQDYITTLIYANILDYTVDESGNLVSGSKTDPTKFEEYWTFTRTSGSKQWMLTAINQV